MAALEPYPDYKDTGLPWLGRIPAHWEVRRNARIFAQRNETGFPDLPILEVSIKTGVRIRNFENSNRKQVMSNREKYKRAAKNDIAYNMMRMWQGAVGVVPEDGLVSPAYVVARPFQEIGSRYYGYLFRTASYMNEVNKYSHGIVTDRNRLYWDEFKQMPSAFPSTEEQWKIADFLDCHGLLVRRFIRAKHRLIELLGEQKQAIIHRALTRGLDPKVRLKPSGIGWILEIPDHWTVVPLRWYIKTRSGDFLDTGHASTSKSEEHQYPVIGGNGIFAYTNHVNCTTKSIVVGRVGALCGNIHVVDEPVWISDNALHCTDVQKFDLDYLALQLRVINLNRLANANAQPLITGSLIKGQKAILPAKDEQETIAGYCLKESKRFKELIHIAQRGINLALEYRTRLIFDVVTGKLDVRGMTLPSAEEAEVSEESNGMLEPEADVIEDMEPLEVAQEEAD